MRRLTFNYQVFLQASAGLAYELAKLGKTASAKAILTPLSEGLSKDSIPSMGLVTLLLQYAEVLALCGEIPKRYMEERTPSLIFIVS